MYISWKPIAVFWRIIIALAGTMALVFGFGLTQGEFQTIQLKYFYNLITILTVAYYYILSFWQINNTKKEKTCLFPWLKGTITVSCAGILIITYFFINHRQIPRWDEYFIANVSHYFIPVMVVLDWLLFDKKGHFKPLFPIIWTIPAMLYTIYSYVSVLVLHNSINFEKTFCYPISGAGNYPYPFFNIEQNGGISNTIGKLLLFALIFIAFGFIMYFIDIIPRSISNFISSRKKSE